jgi:hypothetical protein
MAVSGYAIVSFVLMLGFMWLTSGEAMHRIHMVLQVILGGLLGVILVFLSLNRQIAPSGVTMMPDGVVSTAALSSRLETEEQRLNALGTPAYPCAVEIKSLREIIKYSLPVSGSITANAHYHAFSRRVLDACAGLSEVSADGDGSIGRYAAEMKALQREAKEVAAELKQG